MLTANYYLKTPLYAGQLNMHDPSLALSPSPYHACRFRQMASHRVGLPQFSGISVSGCVALRLPLLGAVVP
jgi:hypothetical protein